MASSYSSFFLLIFVLFISQCTNTNSARDDSDTAKAPDAHVFFKPEDLNVGNKMPIYFKLKSSSRKHFLPKEKADSIPFSSKHLTELLHIFSYSENSPEAKTMEITLKKCEHLAGPNQIKFCATSLESMIDSVRGVLGLDVHIDVLTTKLSPKHKISYQNYTISGEPKVVKANKQLGCHLLPYPYKVYFCHTQMEDHIIYKIPIVGDDGERIDVVGACHLDTSLFDPNHVVFKVLETKPGQVACHFIQADEFFFVASPIILQS